MISVNVIMNSSMEEILAFKCCALPDQNLEVHVKNTSEEPVIIRNFFLLKNKAESLKVENVYPPRDQMIVPNDICAFYCTMDERVWEKYHILEVFDKDGNAYSKTYRSEG